MGGSLYLRGRQITDQSNVHRLRDGDYYPGRYLYADGILTHIKSHKKVGDYTFYAGKIKGCNVIYDGEFYAHCDKFRDGVADLLFKRAAGRGAGQYKELNLDSIVSFEEARIITGACQQGTQRFIDSLREIKE